MPLVTVEASAPAKVILVGEHAVVYGQPAIAVPVSSLRAVATVHASDSSADGFCIAAADEGMTLTLESHPDHPLVVTARLVLRTLQVSPPDVTVTIRSQIPVASGMGSGAAVSAALARAICGASSHSLDNETLNSIIFEVEKIHHGVPSGIDNTVIVYEKPIYFVRGQPTGGLTIGRPLSLLIAYTGLAASTRLAVGDVRKLYEAEPGRIQTILETVGRLVVAAKRAIELGDIEQLGSLMGQNHHLLQQLTVSCTELDNLVSAAMNAGALGAKLSGGGRGGNMIALVTPETGASVKQALLQAGAVSVFAATVE
jgi:mevalonate kinase